MAYESVTEAYKGKSIFITGATGFLGKVIVEKLLYSCPGLANIYLLVREKPNENAKQRIEKLLKQPLFSRLREENPKALEKVVPITGDISQPNIAISLPDKQVLIDTFKYPFGSAYDDKYIAGCILQVSIVIHLAAIIKFNEPFESAINTNVVGTEKVLNLARQLKNVQVFMYMSTAYSNSNREVINEIIYPLPASLSEVKKLIEIGINEDQIKKLLNGLPNTYTFTKALAENLVADNHGNIPAVIIRPSIVCSSVEEPIVGWIDNWFGVTATITSLAKGINRVLLTDPNNVMDLIPVDYVSNLAIIAAAKCKSSKDVEVYNSTTSGENPLTMKKLTDLIIDDSCKHKFNDFPIFAVTLTKVRWLLNLITFLQTIPAYIGDIFLLLSGRKPRFQKIQAKSILVRDSMEYFSLNTWKICATETKALYNSLSLADKRTFQCDPSSINWDTYIPKYGLGIRKFLCKS